jgi:hypothetical protein
VDQNLINFPSAAGKQVVIQRFITARNIPSSVATTDSGTEVDQEHSEGSSKLKFHSWRSSVGGAAWLSGSNPVRDSSKERKRSIFFPARQQEITSEVDSKIYQLFPKLHK